mgnify:CR=1 FL=1
MEKNKVTINIRNQQYTVISEETPDDVMLLADVVNTKLGEIMDSGARISLTEALVLVSLDLANGMKKGADIVSKYKNEMSGYLEDVEKVTIERDKYKRELDKIKGKQ